MGVRSTVLLGLGLWLVSCGAPQPDECKTYLACSEAISPGSLMTLNDTYGPDGTCWQSPSLADTCKQQCTKALTLYRMPGNAGATKPECQ